MASSLSSAFLLAVFFCSQISAQTPVACPGFRTWTQGGYGGSGNGSPAQYLTTNFAAAFPTGLEIGCTNKIRLTTATAVRNFLPQGTSPSVLPAGTLTNPTKTNFNSVLAGQLVTLTLNVRFDQVFASFAPSSTNLRDLVITTGPFLGWTVQQFLDDANKRIGGCSTISNASYSDYNNTADRINRAYDNGISSGNFLACPMTVGCSTRPARCFGTATGSMTVNVAGGVPPYSVVSWSGGASGSFGGTLSATASNLAAGTYTAVIRDASGKQLSTTCSVSQPTQLVASSTAGSILCNGGTTTVTVTANGGTAPYKGTGTFTVGAGNYTYTVTDANGCQTTTSISVSQPSQLNASSSAGNILCFGGTTTVTVSATGGTAPYSGTGTYTVGAGNYTYTVTDANGCQSTTSISVSQPSQLNASSSAGNILCFGGTTTVTVSATGGTAPYSGTGTYTVGAGNYTYTVTDANGCQTTTSISVSQPSQLNATSSAGNILCFGGTTTLTVTATGGTAPYNGTGEFTVGAGDYTYTVTDANGCETTTSISVSQPDLLVAASSAGSILCYGGTTTVMVSASGGTAPYSGTGKFTVGAGDYTYIVTDANGCETTTSISVSQPDLLVASSSAGSILCNGGTTTVTVAAIGGTAPYSGTGEFTVGAGDYTYTVTDANGCQTTTSISLTQPSAMVVTGNSRIASLCNSVPCNGYAEVAVSGGTGAYSYDWTSSSATSTENGARLNNLCGGEFYSVVISDANGCQLNYNFTGPHVDCFTPNCSPMRTYTQGGWGAVPNGNNPGVYLHANFAAAFPAGLTIGCAGNALTFNNAQEITDFLPKGGTSDVLPVLSVLSGQLVAATLSAGFDAYDPNFAAAAGLIGNRIIQSGPFSGMTVGALLNIANDAIGGCSSSYSLSSINAALTAFNENYDNGNTDNGFLGCTAPASSGRIASSFSGDLYPNPAADASSTLRLEASEGEALSVMISDFMGRILFESSSITTQGINEVSLPLAGITARQCIVRVTKGAESFTKILYITK